MRQSFSSVRPETAEQPGPPAPRPGRGTHRRVERHAPQDRGDRMAAPGGRGLRGGHVVSATNVPSYDSGQSGRAEQTLNRLNVTFPPAESVLIQSRAPGRTFAGDPELRQATREAVAALRALPRSATDIRSPLSPAAGRWSKPSSRPITCSAATSRPTCCPMRKHTTSACWPTGRWPTDCSAAPSPKPPRSAPMTGARKPGVHRARVPAQFASRRGAAPLRRRPRRHHRPARGGLGTGPPGRSGRHRRLPHPGLPHREHRRPRSHPQPG